MSSPVSARLVESIAREVQDIIYRPRLELDIAASFEHIIDINEAHLLMLVGQRLIARDAARILAETLARIEAEGPSSLSRDAAREDVHFNLEATLIERTGIEVGGRLHVGRSRNDMGATIDRMRARSACLAIAEVLNDVREQALAQARVNATTVMPGYTHLQPAQPITFGFYCLGIAMALERDFTRLRNAYSTINLSPMGAAAFAGTSFDIDRGSVAQLLGFDGLVEHALDCVASRDFLIELASACVGLGVTWSRLAQDFYVWSTEEFGLIAFPDRVAGTSSIMPQKKNPVVLEYLKATGANNIGSVVSLLTTMRASHFTNSIDGVRASTAGAWASFDTTLNSLKLLRLIVETAEPQHHKMLERVSGSFATITDLADMLVRDFGISFRQAHHISGSVVREALNRGIGAAKVSAEMVEAATLAVTGNSISTPQATVDLCLDPRSSIDRRRSLGGPSIAEVQRMHDVALAQLEGDRSTVAELAARRNEARSALKRAREALINE